MCSEECRHSWLQKQDPEYPTGKFWLDPHYILLGEATASFLVGIAALRICDTRPYTLGGMKHDTCAGGSSFGSHKCPRTNRRPKFRDVKLFNFDRNTDQSYLMQTTVGLGSDRSRQSHVCVIEIRLAGRGEEKSG